MGRIIQKIFIIFFVTFFLFSFSPSLHIIFAQGKELEVKYPPVPGATTPTKTTEALPSYVKYIFNFGVIIFGLVVLAVLVFGGVKYLLSSGNAAKLAEARNQMTAAFLGLVFLLSSYIILTTINPQLVVFDIPGLTFQGVFRCTDDKSCDGQPGCQEPDSCYCDLGICRAKYETREKTLIVYEIPIGQIIEKNIWSDDNIEKAINLLNDFESSLKKEIPVNPTFNRISDLSKYLVGLTEDCRCGAAEAVCATPESGAGGIGCFGDPCKDSREKIQKVIDIITQKITELNDFKQRIEQQFQSFFEGEDKFSNVYFEIDDCLEQGTLMTVNDYLTISQLFNDQGWRTKVEKNPYFPDSGIDELTFYCMKGGTIFDQPRGSLLNIQPIPESKRLITETPTTEVGEIYCPAIIPVGELLQEVGYRINRVTSDARTLLFYIDALSTELQKMLTLVSSCKSDNCNINCAQGPNPCFPESPCVQPGGGLGYPCLKCNPLSLPPCLLCFQGMGLSPNLQSRGTCVGNPAAPYHGSPCPKDDIQETLEQIKILDDGLLELLQNEELITNLTEKEFIVKTPQGDLNILEGTKLAANFCKSSDPDNPSIFIMNCLDAIGTKGPDGNIIADCNPQSFFCCTADKEVANRAFFRVPPGTQALTYYYQQPAQLSGDCADAIIKQASEYEGILYSQNPPPPGSGHCAIGIKSYGAAEFKKRNENKKPAEQYKLDCSGFVSRVYRDVGIFTGSNWCTNTVGLFFGGPGKKLVRQAKAQKGDVIVSGVTPEGKKVISKKSGSSRAHAVLFESGDSNSEYNVLEEGGKCKPSRVCYSKIRKGERPYQKILRAKDGCNLSNISSK